MMWDLKPMKWDYKKFISKSEGTNGWKRTAKISTI